MSSNLKRAEKIVDLIENSVNNKFDVALDELNYIKAELEKFTQLVSEKKQEGSSTFSAVAKTDEPIRTHKGRDVCKYFPRCKNGANCLYSHPGENFVLHTAVKKFNKNGKSTNDSKSKSTTEKKACRYGADCKNISTCKFTH